MTDKNPDKVKAGRKGGQAKVPKGFSTMTPEQRSEIGRKGALTRISRRKK